MSGPIVVTLDGTAAAVSVIPFAALLAKRANAELQLVQVHVLDGDIVSAVLRHLTDCRASFVVTPTRTPPTLRRVFSGHLDDGLIRFAPFPVVICPIRDTSELPKQLDRIVVALDGSPLAERALRETRPLLNGVDVFLLSAVCSGDSIMVPDDLPLSVAIPQHMRKHRAIAEQYLNARAAELRAAGLRVESDVVEGIWPAQTIVRESLRLNADLVVMATHGRTGFARRALGSCAADVLRVSAVPVLVAGPGLNRIDATIQEPTEERTTQPVRP